MGAVYEAEDLDNGRRVGLKTSRRAPENETDHARFLREGRLAASISHPNTMYVFGTEEIDGIPVIVSELATGGTLSDRVAVDGPFAPAQAVDAMLQVIAGLKGAAAAGVLHRDVKPSNCFVDSEGRIKVGDFGLSSRL
jgi:serine/threonine protein kinase